MFVGVAIISGVSLVDVACYLCKAVDVCVCERRVVGASCVPLMSCI